MRPRSPLIVTQPQVVAGTSITVVTRCNGSTTHVDAMGVAADASAANLDLGSNPFYREFTQPVAPTAAALALPEMGGSGWVRDLREAMSLGTPAAAALQATTRDAQRAALDESLALWRVEHVSANGLRSSSRSADLLSERPSGREPLSRLSCPPKSPSQVELERP